MIDPQHLSGRRIVVTGGTTGIGRETVCLLADMGAEVLTVGRERAPLDELLALTAQAPGEVTGITADLATRDGQAALFDAVDLRFGQVDALVANAAVGAEPLDAAADDEWRYVIETNLVGYLACTRAALDRMPGSGDIVLVGSISSDILAPGESVYAATKSGIAGFAEALRKEVADRGIRIALVQPGSVATDMQECDDAAKRKATDEHAMLHAEDIADAIAYILTRPQRTVVVTMRVEPLVQSQG